MTMDDPHRPAPSAPVTGVLFDLGGTLISYRSRQQLGRASATAFQRLGLDPGSPEVREARRAAALEVERDYAARRSFLHRDLFRDRIARAAALLGVDAPVEILDQFTVENTRDLIRHMPPREDAASTLRALRDRGLYCAVVSNADDDFLHATIPHHGLDALLDHWTSSEEADSCKPDRQIFEHALRKARLAHEEVLFVGDSLHHDIAGAHAVGMRSVLISEAGITTPLTEGLEASATPDFAIECLTDLVAIVDDLNRAR